MGLGSIVKCFGVDLNHSAHFQHANGANRTATDGHPNTSMPTKQGNGFFQAVMKIFKGLRTQKTQTEVQVPETSAGPNLLTLTPRDKSSKKVSIITAENTAFLAEIAGPELAKTLGLTTNSEKEEGTIQPKPEVLNTAPLSTKELQHDDNNPSNPALWSIPTIAGNVPERLESLPGVESWPDTPENNSQVQAALPNQLRYITFEEVKP